MIGCKEKEEVVETVMATVEINQITEQEAKEIFLDAYDESLAKEKDLVNSSIYENQYLKMQAAYMSLFNYYLCKEGNLDSYQEMLDSHVFEFPCDEESVIKKYGSCGRNNISILNNLFIERLDKSDLQLLSSSIKGDSLNITESLLEMLERTYAEIITVKYEETNAAFDVIYTHGALYSEEASNKAIVLEIAYKPVLDETGKIKSAAYENEKQKTADMLAELMESELKMALGTEVTVFIRN